MGIIGTCCSDENKKENLPLDSFSCRNCMQTFNRDIDPLGIQFFFFFNCTTYIENVYFENVIKGSSKYRR